jgi:tetratricopeptide (TPR) repeat protein
VQASVCAHQRKKAYELMKQFLADFPSTRTNPDYLVQMGYCANSAWKSKEALASFNAALQLNPSRRLQIESLVGKGIAFRNLGKQRLAQKTMKQALALARKEGNKIVVENIQKLLDSRGIAFPLNGTRPQNHWLSISMCTLVGVAVAFRLKSFIKQSRIAKFEQ